MCRRLVILSYFSHFSGSGTFFENTTNSIYKWEGDEEKWKYAEGSLLVAREFAAASLIPVSSGIFDYCQEYEPGTTTTNEPNKKKEDRPRPWKRMQERLEARKKKDSE